jgi:hypothetical protein
MKAKNKKKRVEDRQKAYDASTNLQGTKRPGSEKRG